jgi:hypothetical protein
MGRHHFEQLNSLTAAEGEPDTMAISTYSTAQLQRVVALCAAVLRETAKSTDDLSERLSFLQKGIESLSGGADRAPRVRCRRVPKCHPNPLFGSPCDCRSVDAPGYDAH